MKETPENTSLQAEMVLDAKATLGEGAFWHQGEQRLYWVDIEGRKLHIFDPATGQDREIAVGERIGTVVPTQDGNALVALQNGIHLLRLDTEELTLIANPLESADIRFNDGKCDPAGRFWVGSMHLEQQENAAALYRMDHYGTVKKILSDKTISNGIVWTSDKKTMYYIDTSTRQVTAYDYDHATGDIANPRVAVEVPEEAGSPDGMAIDAEDKLWVAHYGSHAVIRYNPETGDSMQKINLPVPNVTSCAFGGENLETLYITTVRDGMDEDALARFPQSGGLFSAKPGVRGAAFTLFPGSV